MKYIKYLLIGLVLLSSCKKKSDKDYSLTIEEYQQIGVPDPTRAWNPDDVTIAMDRLTSIKWDKPYTLPRKNSEKSGVLFDRMVGLDNMTFLQDDSLEYHEKAYQSMQYMQLFEGWKDLYTHPL